MPKQQLSSNSPALGLRHPARLFVVLRTTSTITKHLSLCTEFMGIHFAFSAHSAFKILSSIWLNLTGKLWRRDERVKPHRRPFREVRAQFTGVISLMRRLRDDRSRFDLRIGGSDSFDLWECGQHVPVRLRPSAA